MLVLIRSILLYCCVVHANSPSLVPLISLPLERAYAKIQIIEAMTRVIRSSYCTLVLSTLTALFSFLAYRFRRIRI
jgi:hypothetical protein